MKKLVFSLVVLFTSVAAFAQEKQSEIKFDVTEHNFGNFAEGTQATYEFKFTNNGNAPLVLSGVNASCGCTTPSWTKDPIMPGKTGTITAVYNSSGRPGSFTKSITVNSNAKNGTVILTIKGNAEQKPAETPSPVVNPNN